MPELTTSYIIESSPHAVSHPKLYKITSVSGVEVSRQEPTFLEVSLVDVELFSEFLVQFKSYIVSYAESIDETSGINALNQEILRSFEKGIIYASNNARSIDD
jgi:hypothetical protein